MTEQERAAALADEIERAAAYGRDLPITDADDVELLVRLCRAYARPDQDDLREAIDGILIAYDTDISVDRRKTVGAILSILPQTQELAIKNAVGAKLLEMRQAGEIFTLGQVNDLVQAAASFDARAKAADNILRYEEE